MEEHPMNYISKPGKSYSVKCNLALFRQEWYQIKKRSDCQILKNGVKLPEISWNPFFLKFCFYHSALSFKSWQIIEQFFLLFKPRSTFLGWRVMHYHLDKLKLQRQRPRKRKKWPRTTQEKWVRMEQRG